MYRLSLDLLREIFNYLEPRDYRNLRQVNKLSLKASNDPLTPFIYYQGRDFNSFYWKLKLDRLGTCKAFLLSSDPSEEPTDGLAIIEVKKHNKKVFNFLLDEKGFFNSLTVTTTPSRGTQITCYITVNNGVPDLSTILEEYSRVSGIKFKLDDFVISYYSTGKVRTIKAIEDDDELCIRRIKDHYEISRSYDSCHKTLKLGGRLIYLPACLSKKYISVKANNLQEIFDSLPLHLSNCRSKEEASSQVEYMLTRMDFLLVSVMTS